MSTQFDPGQSLVVVRARLKGPKRPVELRLAVDTGATSTLISRSMLAAAGFDPDASGDQVEMLTGSGIEWAPVVRVTTFRALDKMVRRFPVVAHDLPESAQIDGVIGLDFLRGRRLTIDFASGTIELESR